MKKRKFKIRENKQQAKPLKEAKGVNLSKKITNKRIAKKMDVNYSLENLARHYIKSALAGKYHKDATIYNYDYRAGGQVIKELVTAEWQDASYKGFSRKEHYLAVMNTLNKSVWITPPEVRGKNNFKKTLTNNNMKHQFEEIVGESIDTNNLHALDDKSWVYWAPNGQAIKVSFYNTSTGGSLYTPEISIMGAEETRYLASKYGGRV